MVSILPSERTGWDVLGKQIGSNLSQNLPGAVQQGYQRQTGLNAIDQLQNDLKSAGGDLTKILPAIARAYTLNPSLERSGIAEKFIPLAQRQQGIKDFPTEERTGVTSETSQQIQQEPPLSVFDLVPPRQSMIQDPQGTSNFQLPYDEQNVQAIRQKSRELGYTPEMEERFVQDAVEANNIAQTRRNVELQNYQQQQQERQDTLENQAQFTKYLRENAPEFGANPDELELALKSSEKYQGEKSFAERLAKVKNDLRPYQASKKALQKTLNRPLLGQTKEQRQLARPRAQMMVEMGQKPQLQLMIAQGGHGEVEEADLLNPLPEELEKNLNKFGKLASPLANVTNIDPDSPEYAKQFQEGLERKQRQSEQLVDFLSREITSGTYESPGTNLLLVRKHIMDKGAQWDEAGSIIDDAIKGKKLDPQQKIDYQKLAYPPLTGDDYSDTVLNNLLFPITGKQ